MDPVVQMAFIIAGLLLLGALGEFIFSRTGVPDMVWLVAAGIVAGPVFKLITQETLTPALPFFGAIALIVILLGAAFSSVSPMLPPQLRVPWPLAWWALSFRFLPPVSMAWP